VTRADVIRRMASARRLGMLLGFAQLAGCSAPSRPAISALPPLPHGAIAAPPRINGAVGTPDALPAPQVSYGTPAQAAVPGGGAVAGGAAGQPPGDITLNFADTDIREVVAQILGNILKVNYAIDPAVHGSATLHTVRPLNRSELLPVLESLLSQNGAALVVNGGLYRVVPVAQAAASAAASAATAGAVVVPLRYTSADALLKVLQPYVGAGGRIAADPARNALLISGDPQSRASLIALVRAFDTNALAGQSYAVFPVTNGDVKDVAGALEDAFRSQKGGALAGLLRVVPLPRMNAVLVVSPQSNYIDQARRLYGVIDRTRRETLRSWHVFYLQNSHSEDVAYVLQEAFTPNDVTAQPSAHAQLPGAQGGAGTLGVLGGGSGGFSMPGSGTSNLTGVSNQAGGSTLPGQIGGNTAQGAPAAVQQQPPAANANPLLGGLQPGGAATSTDTLRIIPDDQNNAILVYGTYRETDTIEAMLRKIDIMPLEVRIDAVIAEVTLNDNLQYGTQFFFRSGGINGILNAATQTPANAGAASLNMSFPGFFLGGSGAGGAPFAIQALQQVTTVRVLSSPEILVLDNQPARLQVGNVVPYLSQTSQSTISSGAPVVNSINYQQTGVIMQVTPRVNSGGLVTLDVMQDVSEVANGITTQGIDSPTFEDRNVESRVVVQDGQTIGLAGLIQDNTSVGNQGIPWLKDVPVLGLLAGNQNNTRQRTELLILITPHVIHDQRDAQAMTEDLRDQLINAAAVPNVLNNLGPTGASDPGARLRRQLHLQ
jgi:general secretion pathway protein D